MTHVSCALCRLPWQPGWDPEFVPWYSGLMASAPHPAASTVPAAAVPATVPASPTPGQHLPAEAPPPVLAPPFVPSDGPLGCSSPHRLPCLGPADPQLDFCSLVVGRSSPPTHGGGMAARPSVEWILASLRRGVASERLSVVGHLAPPAPRSL